MPKLSLMLGAATSRWTCSLQFITFHRYSAMPSTTKIAVVMNRDCCRPDGSLAYFLICGATTNESIRIVRLEPQTRQLASLARSVGTWVIAGAIDP